MSQHTLLPEDTTQGIVDWLVDAAFGGVAPLTGAADLAHEYLLDQGHITDDQRADRLIRDEVNRHYTTGFLAGFAWRLTLPPGAERVARPVVASWVIGARMAGGVAGIYRHDLESDAVRAIALLAVTPTIAVDLLREADALPPDLPLQEAVTQLRPHNAVGLEGRVVKHLLLSSTAMHSSHDLLVPGHSADELVDPTWCCSVGRTALMLLRRDTNGTRAATGSLRIANWEVAS